MELHNTPACSSYLGQRGARDCGALPCWLLFGAHKSADWVEIDTDEHIGEVTTHEYYAVHPVDVDVLDA